MSSRKSVIWNFYDKSTDGGVCKLCKCAVKTSGNTTNLKNHIKRKHPSVNIDSMSKMARNSMSSSIDESEANFDEPAEINFAVLANQIVDTVSLIN